MATPTKAVRPKKRRIAPIALDLKERTRLIELLNDPVMQKALNNATTAKPGAFYAGAGVTANGTKDTSMAMLIANNRLHEIRGWEMFEAALFAQCEDPKAPREQTTETYPDEQQ